MDRQNGNDMLENLHNKKKYILLPSKICILVLAVFCGGLTFSLANAESFNLQPPSFSHDSGFYPNEFDLTIAHPEPGIKIYYTLDGSDPDPDNLNGTTFHFKNEYAQPPATKRIGELIGKEYRTLLYSQPLHITDRTYEPDRISQISTTFDENPTYFPHSNPELDENGKETGRTKYLYKGTPVRAFALASDGKKSEIVTKIFFIGDQNTFSLPIINITIPEKELFDYDDGILVAGKKFDIWAGGIQKNEIPAWPGLWDTNYNVKKQDTKANIYILNNDLSINQDIDLRVHGGNSRIPPQKTLRIYPRKKYNSNGLDFDLYNDGSKIGFLRFLLRAGSGYQSFISDAAAQETMTGLNVGRQRYQPYITFINGEYNGILNARDRRDHYYIAEYYNLPSNKIDHLKYAKYRVMHGDDNNWLDLQEFIEVSDKNSTDFLVELDKKISISSFIDFYISGIYLARKDWPANNIAYWRYSGSKKHLVTPDGYTDGKWRWFLYDIDAFGANIGSTEEDYLLYATNTNEDVTDNANPPFATFMFRKLIENSEVKCRFITRFSDLLNSHFVPSRMTSIVRNIERQIEKEMPRHIQRWSTPESMEVWRAAVNDLVDFFKQRPQYQWEHLQKFFNLADQYNLNIDLSERDCGRVRLNTLILGDDPRKQYQETDAPLFFPWSGKYFQNLPLTLEAIPARGYQFSHWEILGMELSSEEKYQQKLILKPATDQLDIKVVMDKKE